MPGVDWQRFKAQLAVESSFRETAQSPVGAAGLAQLMPGTAKDIGRSLGYQVNPYNPRHAIQAGAYYMGKLRRSWSWKRPERDKQILAESSYNAGLGNLLKAQRACDNAVLYSQIIVCLPSITGHHSTETINYVIRIDRQYRLIKYR